MTTHIIKRKFYRQEFDPTYKYFYRNDCDSSLIPRRGNEPGNETNMTVSYRGYSVTYLNELNRRAYISALGSHLGYSGHDLTNICSDFIATPTAHLCKDELYKKLKPWPQHSFSAFPSPACAAQTYQIFIMYLQTACELCWCKFSIAVLRTLYWVK